MSLEKEKENPSWDDDAQSSTFFSPLQKNREIGVDKINSTDRRTKELKHCHLCSNDNLALLFRRKLDAGLDTDSAIPELEAGSNSTKETFEEEDDDEKEEEEDDVT